MNKQNLPDGWNEVEFLDSLEKEASNNKLKIQGKDFLKEGEYPVVDQGETFIAGYTNDKSKVYSEKLPVVIFGDHTRIFKFIDFPFALGADGVKILVPNNDFDVKYYYYFLRNLKIPSAGYSRHYKFLKEKKIILPPLATQKKIVSILERAEAAKERREEADALTNDFLKSVFLEMFGDPVKNEKRWVLQTINALTEVKTGGTPSRKIPKYYGGSIPWVKTTEVVGSIIYDTEEKITTTALEASNCEVFPVGTVIVAMYGQGLTRGRSAKLGISAATNQACAAILPSSKINSDYLLSYLKQSYFNLRNLGRGGNQPNLNLSMIKSLKIPVPPLPLQEKFASIVEQVEALKEHQKQSKEQIDNLFGALMQKAFKGELIQ